MSESKEINEFGEIRSVLVYLEQVKKGVQNKSFFEQIEFKEEIKKRHDKKQIKMLHGRIEDQFEIKKAISYLVTAFFAIISLVIGSTLSFSLSIIRDNGLDLELGVTVINSLFFIAVGAWLILSNFESGKLSKISSYKRLLQECLDEMPEKSHFRRRV
ncbi:hypothetical protein ABEY46_19480 [Bacillus velezensis]|uniref:hypothetical protein n=1 Tax=Bacillus velezensis TaxID=492670 RepID=UPI002DB58192|nr:hypothetical protein [Bacillus velezensis]MEC3796982.1 hypothetical protein [Bacillus velezensis]MED4526326.1 hypothetical protein [Bacillus velezensis]